MIRSNSESIVEASLRRSDRVPRQLNRYYNYLVWNGDPVELNKNNKDLIRYMDAMQRSNSDKYLKAKKSEIESMKINDVWTLIDSPKGIKSIRCK